MICYMKTVRSVPHRFFAYFIKKQYRAGIWTEKRFPGKWEQASFGDILLIVGIARGIIH